MEASRDEHIVTKGFVTIVHFCCSEKLTFVPIFYYYLVKGLILLYIYPKKIALIYYETLSNYLGNGKYIHLMSQIYFLDFLTSNNSLLYFFTSIYMLYKLIIFIKANIYIYIYIYMSLFFDMRLID